MLETTIDISLIVRFGLKCLGIFALIFLAAVFTPKMAEAFDKWKAKHFPKSAGKKSGTRETYHVRSIYELPPEPEQPKKKAVVRKKADKNHKS
ncbi:MAG: hypothetical protein IJ644_11085 [Oscillospiraceae bacterium]|nr:hypothetical protein [Oscillospiraceae bacterium]